MKFSPILAHLSAFIFCLSLHFVTAQAENSIYFKLDTSSERVILWGEYADLKSELNEVKLLRNEGNFCSEKLISCTGTQCNLDITNCLTARLRQNLNRTFLVSGPNCFASALHLTGLYPTVRGVDEAEFRAFTQIACKKVKDPQPGDLGVFENPYSREYTHTYVYLSDLLGMDKPGVDYLGPTAIRVHTRENIFFRAEASPECRKYAPDPSVCSNKHYFLRCSQPTLVLNNLVQAHNSDVLSLEYQIQALLDQQTLSLKHLTDYNQMLDSYNRALESIKPLIDQLPEDQYRLYQLRLESLQDQLRFISLRLSSLEKID